MNKKIINSLRKVCDYLYWDEYKNWNEYGRDSNHIFNSVHVLELFTQSIEEKKS